MAFKELKPELMDLQATWGSQIQAAKAPKGAEGAPFPVKVLLEMEQPPACSNWDVEWLKVLLVIEGPELDCEDPADLPLKVEYPQTDLPSDVRREMAMMTLDQWRATVTAATNAPRWRLQETLSWVQTNYDKLLRVIPQCVDWYMGEDQSGISQRRYTITPQVEVVIAPAPVIKSSQKTDESNNDSDSGELTPEQRAKREAYEAKIAESERLRKIQEQREEEEYKREIARKKEEAMAARERGEVIVKPNQLSKKELEEKRKSKQGVRTSKTGSKATKYAGEGSAIEKAKAGGGGGKKKK